ncbi:hypothetical protein HMPREF9418_1455, partial [Neisseria macacae ATCC 33926]
MKNIRFILSICLWADNCYSGLTLNQYGVASPCRTISVLSAASSPCPDLNLIHY